MTKTTTKNRRAVGTLGVAAVIAVLAVSMIAMNFTSPVLADHVPAKSGYVGGSELSGITSEGYVIEPFLFKSNKGGNILFDLTIECSTMTHIKGKGKMDSFDGANVDAKVWFVWKENQVGPWVTIPIGHYDETVGDAGEWNLCEQDFQIKTNLNDLFERCTDEQVANQEEFPECTEVGNLFFECNFDGTTRTGFEESECEQSVELFLKTAGTRPAAALLMDVPNGIHYGAVMAKITVSEQEALAEECYGPEAIDCDIKTALILGKRLLIVEDLHLANDAGL